MKNNVARKVVTTYNSIAPAFAKTRHKREWGEFSLFTPYVGSCVLDIGCGSGRLAQFFNIKKYIGIDVSDGLLAEAKKLLGKVPSAVFQKMDMRALEFKDNTFDSVFMVASLNHLVPKYHKKALGEAYRVLKHGGYLFVTNFNLWRFDPKSKTIWNTKLKRVGGLRGVETLWQGKSLYYYAFTKRELKRLIKKAGFNVKKSLYTIGSKRAHILSGRNIVIIARK
jgi:ubiquinone/menaquinone biosynthesis C-methylase UbiE